MIRVGLGIDFHRFAPGRRLILGGVEVAYELGLAGHSDADVLTHAICDALLGAAGLGDIGRHFPDSDPQYKDISSLILLRQVRQMARVRKYRVNNIDACIVAQEPRLAPYAPAMVGQLATVLQISEGMINVKATTPERLGAIGRGEGIAAYAVATLVAAQEFENVVVGDEEHQPHEDDEPDVMH
jgi:2-C-methyl-D-erythritol 2,4-cyclodiphosphate synthase